MGKNKVASNNSAFKLRQMKELFLHVVIVGSIKNINWKTCLNWQHAIQEETKNSIHDIVDNLPVYQKFWTFRVENLY